MAKAKRAKKTTDPRLTGQSMRAKKTTEIKAKAAKAKAETAKAKAKMQAEAKASQTTAIRKLNPLAKEINIRLDKADVAKTKASDHTLSAALRLAEAKDFCKTAKIKFEDWCLANITKSYDRARKLAAVGSSENPALALADMREDTAKRTQKTRAKRNGATVAPTSLPASTPPSPFQLALDSVTSLDSKARENLVASVAATKGMRVISDHDHNELMDLRVKAHMAVISGQTSVERVIHDFDGLSAGDKMTVTRHAAKKVGVELVVPDFDPVKDQPKFLKRKKKKGGTTPTVSRGVVAA